MLEKNDAVCSYFLLFKILGRGESVTCTIFDYLLRRYIFVSRIVMRCTLMSVCDPFTIAVPNRWTIVTFNVSRGMMSAMGYVFFIVYAAIKGLIC